MTKEASFLRQYAHSLITARASTAIYLILHCNGIVRRSVLVPADLCYAGIYPVLYSGNRPLFCDVDPVTGNMTYPRYLAAVTREVAAVIVPHMYGNPVEDLPAIAAHCKENGILLIEDCACAMGAETGGYSLGHAGDYAVYSTGYSKTLDIGFGGIVCSDTRDLTALAVEEQALPALRESDRRDMALFSKLYRLLRNEGHEGPLEKAIYRVLPDACKGAFLHRLPADQKALVQDRLSELPAVLQARRDALAYYAQRTAGTSYARYPFLPGAAPWRFNLLVEPERKSALIAQSLRLGLPVSDWYPRVTPLFDCAGAFPGAEQHERRILNYPLLLAKEKIDAICDLLRSMEK